MTRPKVFFNWSSGKDAAMALYQFQQAHNPPDLLLTTLSKKYQRVTMHGLRCELLEAQANALALPLDLIELEDNPSMESYGQLMTSKLEKLKSKGFTQSAFGDIFLEDLKLYREKMLSKAGIKAIFPIWQRDTRELITEFIDSGFQAIIICINAQVLPKSYCGRYIDHKFLDDLPSGVDPCGENGEFHTFCFDGPIFDQPVPFVKGDLVYKTYPAPSSNENKGPKEYGYWFCDLKYPSAEQSSV